MSPRADEVVVCGIPCSRSAGQRRRPGFSLEPQRVNCSSGRNKENVVEYCDTLHGILQVDVRRYVDTRIPVEKVVIDGPVGNDAAILSPHMDTIVMVDVC